MSSWIQLVSALVSTAALLFTSSTNAATPDFKLPVGSDEIKVMAYNVENLFDTQHDKNKDDFTFLPKGFPGKDAACAKVTNTNYRKQCYNTDWTTDRLEVKLEQIARVIEAQGDLPDILVLEEVENENVTSMLAAVLGYPDYMITEGPDERGIDVALLFKTDKLKYIAHEDLDVTSSVGFETRPILKVHFKTKTKSQKNLFVFGNHWPSQASGTPARAAAAKVLKKVIMDDQKKYGEDNYFALAMGDFNVLEDESPNPIWDTLFSGTGFESVHELAEQSRNPMRSYFPPGTYHYGGDNTWNRFDKILVSSALLDGQGTEVLTETFRILYADFMTKTVKGGARVPLRYDHNSKDPKKAGFSDHLPIYVKIRL